MRDMVAIGNYQFGFSQGRSTAGAVFILRMLQEKYIWASTKKGDRVGFKEKKDTWKDGRGSYGVVCELRNKS